jgi:molybdopterin molybdotransferase
VAIISTGDELLTPDQAITPGKIRDTNSYSLRGMVQALGAEPIPLGIARDTEDAVREKFNLAAEAGADVILSSAGVSVGARDVVKTVLDELGELDFWRVNMRPGKPLAFGSSKGMPVFGLPGNPVSSRRCVEVFVRPSILKMLGWPVAAPTLDVSVGHDMSSDGRESFIRVTLLREDGQLVARETGTQSSGALSSLVKADGLLIIPAGVTQVRAGDTLKVRPFGGQPIWM